MKLSSLFEAKAWVGKENTLDWIIQDTLFGPGDPASKQMWRDYKASKVLPSEWLIQEHDANIDNIIRDNRLTSYEFDGDKLVKCPRSKLTCWNIDQIGKPKFIFGETPELEFCIEENTKVVGIEDWFPTVLKRLYIGNCKPISFKGISKHIKQCESIMINGKHGKQSVLPGGIPELFQIKGLKEVDFTFQRDLQNIINKHLKTGDVFECQDELIDAGLAEYAK